MVPVKRLVAEKYRNKHCEHKKCENLLYHFEFYKCKRASVRLDAYSVGRNHETVFKKGDAP